MLEFIIGLVQVAAIFGVCIVYAYIMSECEDPESDHDKQVRLAEKAAAKKAAKKLATREYNMGAICHGGDPRGHVDEFILHNLRIEFPERNY